jgi:hypothetical protein
MIFIGPKPPFLKPISKPGHLEDGAGKSTGNH